MELRGVPRVRDGAGKIEQAGFGGVLNIWILSRFECSESEVVLCSQEIFVKNLF